MLTLPDIQSAHRRIADAICHSPCPYSLSLSKLCRCQIFCKLDHLQMTGSFKERGARNKLLIATAILRLLELEKMVVEGAGATPLAALTSYPLHLENKKVVLLLSGGNIDVTLISRIIERGLAAEGRLTRLTVRISERPGSLAQILTLIAHAGGSIKEVAHDRNFGPLDVARVNVSCIVETRDFAHIQQIRSALTQAGIDLLPESPATVIGN